LRCQATGLECAGYESTAATTSPTASTFASGSAVTSRFSSPNRQLPSFDGNPREKRAFDFFYHKAVPLLSGYFYGEFFSDGLLQIGFQDPAVRHGIIAFSAVFENECVRGLTSEPTGEVDRSFAIESYNLAIRHLLAHLDNRQDNVLVPLMTCVIFVCIDCVRHDVIGAMGHIKGGLKLLETFRARKDDQLSGITQSHRHLLSEVVVPIFAWLNMTGSIFGDSICSASRLYGDEDREVLSRPKPENIDQALLIFLDIVAAFIDFARINGNAKYSMNRNPAIAIENLRLLSEFDTWRTQLDELLASSYTPKMENAGINLLIAAFKAVRMWTESFLYPNETIWDAYKSDYDEILQLVASALDDSLRFPDQTSKSFAFEMPMIPILHFVAIKCRWPQIRRRAIDYLRMCPQRECMFTSRYSLILAEKVMEIEELSLPKGRSGVPADNALPSEASRIYHINFPPLSGSRHGRAVNFLTKPQGISEPWSIRTDYINIKSIELLRWFDITGTLEDHAPEMGMHRGGINQVMVNG
jgi:hypothetical protein